MPSDLGFGGYVGLRLRAIGLYRASLSISPIPQIVVSIFFSVIPI